MPWLHMLAWFFGGAFLSNAIPHYVRGAMGQPFQSPFASPPGKGLSSSTVNVLWGCFNLVVAYLLLVRVGTFDPRSALDIGSLGLGFTLMGAYAARRFGRFHGGNDPLARAGTR